MLTLFDDDVGWTQLHNRPGRLHDVHLFRELSGLSVIQRDEVDLLQQTDQVATPTLYPEVHRVARNQRWAVVLIEDVELTPRTDVREEDERCVAQLLGNF